MFAFRYSNAEKIMLVNPAMVNLEMKFTSLIYCEYMYVSISCCILTLRPISLG
jgi:hypothetical protein